MGLRNTERTLRALWHVTAHPKRLHTLRNALSVLAVYSTGLGVWKSHRLQQHLFDAPLRLAEESITASMMGNSASTTGPGWWWGGLWGTLSSRLRPLLPAPLASLL